MTERERLRKCIDKNRDEINRLLNKNVPLGILYDRIRMLSSQNKMMVCKLKELADNE